MSVDKIKKGLRRMDITPAVQAGDYLSSGSTLLNLACTGFPYGGFTKGKYFFIVGDSASGKTFLSLTCFAEACINPSFKDYRLIFDDVEGGALMSIEEFFGKAVARRMEPPRVEDGRAVYSQTIEEFYAHLDDALRGEKPVIYVLDSMDALSSEYEREKTQERKTALRKGSKPKGDYGDGKAKRNASGIRSQLAALRDTGSILIILNQTRDRINAGFWESSKTRSGGHALTFYATTELWSSVAGSIKRTVRGLERKVGVHCRIQVKKNRITGRDRTIVVPIYYSYGIDDIGSCVDYLIAESHWTKTRTGLVDTRGELSRHTTAMRGELIRWIEEQKLEVKLREIVAMVWADVEAACEEDRKPRYI